MTIRFPSGHRFRKENKLRRANNREKQKTHALRGGLEVDGEEDPPLLLVAEGGPGEVQQRLQIRGDLALPPRERRDACARHSECWTTFFRTEAPPDLPSQQSTHSTDRGG